MKTFIVNEKKGCDDCPFFRVDQGNGDNEGYLFGNCAMKDNKQIFVSGPIAEPDEITVIPGWCPLREDSIQLKLKQ